MTDSIVTKEDVERALLQEAAGLDRRAEESFMEHVRLKSAAHHLRLAAARVRVIGTKEEDGK